MHMASYGGISEYRRLNQIAPSNIQSSASEKRIFRGTPSKLSEMNQKISEDTQRIRMRSTVRRKIFEGSQRSASNRSLKSSNGFRGSGYSEQPRIEANAVNPIKDRLLHIKQERQNNRSKSRERQSRIRRDSITRNPIITHQIPPNHLHPATVNFSYNSPFNAHINFPSPYRPASQTTTYYPISQIVQPMATPLTSGIVNRNAYSRISSQTGTTPLYDNQISGATHSPSQYGTNKYPQHISEMMKKPIVFRSVDLASSPEHRMQQDSPDGNRLLASSNHPDPVHSYNNMLSTYNPHQTTSAHSSKISYSKAPNSENRNNYDTGEGIVHNYRIKSSPNKGKKNLQETDGFQFHVDEEEDDEDRFFDMDLKFSKRQESVGIFQDKDMGQHNRLSPLQPTRLNNLRTNSADYESNNAPRSANSITFRAKVTDLIKKADSEGKLVTLVLVGLGILLVLFQMIR